MINFLSINHLKADFTHITMKWLIFGMVLLAFMLSSCSASQEIIDDELEVEQVPSLDNIPNIDRPTNDDLFDELRRLNSMTEDTE